MHAHWICPQSPLDQVDLSASSAPSSAANSLTSGPSATATTPPATPHNGTSTEPPFWGYCGEHPGVGWVLNSPRTTHFYRFIIPHPDNGAPIIAPFLQYHIALEGSEVFGTFGQGYIVHKRALRPTPVEYDMPPLTPEQLRIFDASEPFAYAVSKVVDEYFPYDLLATVRQYQFYKSTQYALQRTIQAACVKEMKYTKKALEVLLEMENANVLGRLLAHMDILSMALAPKPDAHFAYIKAIRGFDGDITETALDPRVNRHRSTVKEQGEPIPDSVFDEQCAKEQRIIDKREDAFERRKRQCQAHAAIFPLHARKQCFRCGHYRHIRLFCPQRTPPLSRKWGRLTSMTLAPTHPSVRLPPLMTAIVIARASLADCWLVSDSSDYPTYYNIATTLFALDICPHYLVVLLPSITIRVCLLSDVFLSCHMIAVPPTIKPPSGLHQYLRRF